MNATAIGIGVGVVGVVMLIGSVVMLLTAKPAAAHEKPDA
jgi:hypothetical protein